MPTKKKNTKKYSLSRSDIESRLSDLVDRLNDIDTTNTAPIDVSDEINNIASELSDLQYEVTDEAF